MREQTHVTAYHEAGHAVMAMSCGFPVSRISIRPNETSLGHVAYSIREELTPGTRRRLVLVSCGGLAADYLHYRKNTPSGVNEHEAPMGHFGDQEHGRNMLSLIGESGEFDNYLTLTLWYLGAPERWRIVEEIASVLIQAGAIDGAVLLRRWAEACPALTDDEIEKHKTLLTHVPPP